MVGKNRDPTNFVQHQNPIMESERAREREEREREKREREREKIEREKEREREEREREKERRKRKRRILQSKFPFDVRLDWRSQSSFVAFPLFS